MGCNAPIGNRFTMAYIAKREFDYTSFIGLAFNYHLIPKNLQLRCT